MADEPVGDETAGSAEPPETPQPSWNLRTIAAAVIIAGVVVGATFCAAGDEAFQLTDSAPASCVAEIQPGTCESAMPGLRFR